VSGFLGFAAAGLELLRSAFEPDNSRWHPFREQHLNPTARVEAGQKLGASGLVHAMMDLSDGLATDLAHLCNQSGVGAKIHSRSLPGISALHDVAGAIGGEPEDWAIKGGDDYELLFTAAADARDQLLAIGKDCDLQLSPVGTIVTGRGVTLIYTRPDGLQEEKIITYQGFDHFREQGEDEDTWLRQL
ncbi:MAG: thiamine-phosphate kinase, partial [Desulfobulbus sp.]|nr:thiamine-phosphate kinase [Desulfobulbus sp.]